MIRALPLLFVVVFFVMGAKPQPDLVSVPRGEMFEIIGELQRRRTEITKLRADVTALQRTLGIEKSACASRLLSEQLRCAEIKKVCHEAAQCTAWKIGIGICVGVGVGMGVAGFQAGRAFK